MDKAVEAGQAIYSKKVLSIYDWWVLGISNSFIWQCPTELLEHEFRKHVSDNHLDIGVGTGYYLEHCLPETITRVGLLDLNQNSLDEATGKVSKVSPDCYQANVLEKLNIDCPKYDSASLNFLMHCVPGDIKTKARIFDNILPLLNPGCRVFGSTLLTEGVKRSFAAKSLMALYNQKGIFSNSQDRLEDLNNELRKRFIDIEVYTVGCVAIFSASVASNGQ